MGIAHSHVTLLTVPRSEPTTVSRTHGADGSPARWRHHQVSGDTTVEKQYTRNLITDDGQDVAEREYKCRRADPHKQSPGDREIGARSLAPKYHLSIELDEKT